MYLDFSLCSTVMERRKVPHPHHHHRVPTNNIGPHSLSLFSTIFEILTFRKACNIYRTPHRTLSTNSLQSQRVVIEGRGMSTPRESERKGPPPSTTTTRAGDSADVTFPIIIALFFVLITIGYYLWSRKSRRGRSVLLVGPCEAGKTAVFSRIVGGPVIQTVTSTVPNQLDYSPRDGKKAALVIKDLPGHDRVQIKFWDSHKLGARAIVCVVDSAAGNKGIREAADVLYRVLTDATVTSASPNIYILANKQDLPTAKGIKYIRTQLEKELTTLRMTKAAGLTSTRGKETSGKLLGKMDKDFDFDHLSQMKIDFGEGCGNGDVKELEGLFLWLDRVA